MTSIQLPKHLSQKEKIGKRKEEITDKHKYFEK